MVVIEVFSGRIPFYRMNDGAVIWKVMGGARPGRPETGLELGLSDDLWQMVQECWREDPDERPRIHDVLQRLSTAASEYDHTGHSGRGLYSDQLTDEGIRPNVEANAPLGDGSETLMNGANSCTRAVDDTLEKTTRVNSPLDPKYNPSSERLGDEKDAEVNAEGNMSPRDNINDPAKEKTESSVNALDGVESDKSRMETTAPHITFERVAPQQEEAESGGCCSGCVLQ